MSDRIKYICYYDTHDSTCKRNYVLSATNKLEYIWEVMSRMGYIVDVVSVSNCVETKFQYTPGNTRKINDSVYLRTFPSFGGSKIAQWIGRYYLRIFFIIWFICNVHKGEKVLVYHSLGYCKLLLFLQRLVKCSYVGEIEELYQDVVPQRKAMREKENKFIKICDSYIFPSKLLNDKLNTCDKPAVIVQGIYRVEEKRVKPEEDGFNHIVYAGTFDKDKGVLEAINATKFLPQNYHVHILGFGNSEDVSFIKGIIKDISNESNALISYDGCLTGDAFISFLQKCKIGLCPQNPQAAFNATSFPSKILTYLSNGLQVVTIDVPAIKQSVIASCLHFYKEQTPEQLANTIEEAAVRPFTGISEKLIELDGQFALTLGKLLKA